VPDSRRQGSATGANSLAVVLLIIWPTSLLIMWHIWRLGTAKAISENGAVLGFGAKETNF
jgi:ABC-type sulfate transport system permease component